MPRQGRLHNRYQNGSSSRLARSSIFSGGQPVTFMPSASPHIRQHFLDLVQGFAAEIRRAQHFLLGLLHQVADIDDIVVLQAIRTADRQLQLVHLAQQIAVERQVVVVFLGPDLLRLVEIHEQLQLVLQDAGGQRHRVLRPHRAVGFHRQHQLVVIGDLTHAGRLHLVRHAAHRAVDCIDRDQPDRRIFRPVGAGRHIAAAQLRGQLHAELGTLIERADDQLGVHDVDVVAGLDLAGADLAGARWPSASCASAPRHACAERAA